jgi:hypothetical protein
MALGGIVWWKNWGSKILWYCPLKFKILHCKIIKC